MIEKLTIETNCAPKAIGAYSQGIFVNGTYYFSGMLGLNPETMNLEIGIDNQISRILKNIDGLLESQNLNRNNIVKTTIFLASLDDFALINQKYEQYFTKPYPARSCIEAKALPKNALVEIEVIACK